MMRSVAAMRRVIRSLRRPTAWAGLLLAAALSGCGLLPEVADETTKWSANKLYAEAKDAMAEKSWDKAIKYFEKLESRYPFGRFAQQAQIESAYAYFKAGETANAIAACDRFIKLHPEHPHVDYVYYLRGLVNFNEDLGLLGHISRQDLTERDPKGMRESFDAFKTLVTRFPDSKYSDDARLRLAYLVNAMAQHEVHVANYYMRRGAYLAAANRARTALTTYPDAPAIEEALFIMVKSYDQLRLTDLRDDTERVMRLNYPNSAYYRGGRQTDEPWWKLW